MPVIPGAAGTPVYWDLVGGDPKTCCPYFKYTRHDVCVKLEAFVDGGPRSVVSDLAVDVARRRIAGDRSLSRPWLWLDDDTVTLSQKTQEQCVFLALEDSVAETFGRPLAVAAARRKLVPR